MSDVFGIGPSEEEMPDFLKDDPQPTDEEAPVEEAPTEEPSLDTNIESTIVETDDEEIPSLDSPAAGQPQDEAEDDKTSEEPVAVAPAEEHVWAGKYKDPEQLEKGYRELRDLQRRTAERAKAYEQRAAEVEFQAQQMKQALDRAMPLLEQQRQQQQAPPEFQYDQFGNIVPTQPQQPQWTPDMIQPLVDQMVQERLAGQARSMQEAQWQQQQYAEAETALNSFFEAHPEVVRDSEADEDVANTVLALNEAWAPTGSSVDISSTDALEIAYEAAQRPALRQVLEMNPQFFDTDEGMVLAREFASKLDGNTQGASAQPTRMTARPNTPVVERGSSPAPQQGTPQDEYDAAVAEYHGASKSRGSDVFFGE